MYRIKALLLIVLLANSAKAEEMGQFGPAGFWIAKTEPSRCINPYVPVKEALYSPTKEVGIRIKRTDESYRIEGLRVVVDAQTNGEHIAGFASWKFSVDDKWLDYDKTEAEVKILNRLEKTYAFIGYLKEDNVIVGRHLAGCYSYDNSGFIDANWYLEELDMRRIKAAPFIVTLKSTKNIQPLREISADDVVRIAIYFSDNWPDPAIEIDQVIWSGPQKELVIGTLPLFRSGHDARIYLSGPIGEVLELLGNQVGVHPLVGCRTGSALLAQAEGAPHGEETTGID
ncbi:MAG: hypothetical protein OEU92_10530, partial [Alphaproteobacteria bacterium]|nr:hypothetical protein [Alphaproteobacteria bacterium]